MSFHHIIVTSFLTSLSVLGVAYPMKGHPEDEFAKRGGSLKEESVCSSLFFFSYVHLHRCMTEDSCEIVNNLQVLILCRELWWYDEGTFTPHLNVWNFTGRL